MSATHAIQFALSPLAFPSVVTTSNGTSSNGTSSTINLPSGIASGNLLIAFVQLLNTATITTPSGWTSLASATLSGTYSYAIFYRVADGSEGSTLAITTSASAFRAYAVLRISNYQGTPEISSMATAISATPDCPSLSPSWGSDDNLWIAVAFAINGATGTPSGYGGGITFSVSRVSYKQATAASEDPAAYSQSGSVRWEAYTLAVRGA